MRSHDCFVIPRFIRFPAMNKNEFENKSLVYIILIGYVFNFLFTIIGYVFCQNSQAELLNYQLANAFAISASVMAARYTGLRAQHVAASAYILFGITHGISLATLSKAGINADRGITMVIPMIPAFIFMFWCNLYPQWLRLLGLIPAALFALVYVRVQSGLPYFGWELSTGYAALQITEVLWGIYLFMDWKQQRN